MKVYASVRPATEGRSFQRLCCIYAISFLLSSAVIPFIFFLSYTIPDLPLPDGCRLSVADSSFPHPKGSKSTLSSNFSAVPPLSSSDGTCRIEPSPHPSVIALYMFLAFALVTFKGRCIGLWMLNFSHLTHWGRVTQICVVNTRLFSLHNTLNYGIHRACLRMVPLTDVYRNLTSLWINL